MRAQILHEPRHLPAVTYAVALAATVAAVFVRWLLNPLLDHRLPFITLYGAVAVAVWFGGWGPALLTTVAGYVGTYVFFFETELDAPLSLKGPGGVAGLALYLGSCLIIIGFGNGMRAAKRRAEVAALEALSKQEQMEHEMAERRKVEETLRDANRCKDEFLATLAHELRNPLAPITNAVEVLRQQGASDPEVQWSRGVIERQVNHLVRLVDDLLDLSRITRGKIGLKRERIPIADVVTSALETSRPLIEASGHQLTVTLSPEPLFVHGDLTRLAQVMANLLNNAAKYTGRGGHIVLTVDREDTETVLRVRDNGVGIPAEMLPRVFDMFTQADRALERTTGGLGIGLTLVRRLVEMHDGRVVARSDGPGKGSEFTVFLPLALDGARAPRPEEPKVKAPQSPQRILVVDDNQDAAESLAMLLRLEGHEVGTAKDGLEGVQKAATIRPHVVFLDIGMPKLNGYEAAQRIREQPGGERIVLVALTGWGQRDDRRRAVEAGFQHYLTKPVDHAVLAELLNSVSLS